LIELNNRSQIKDKIIETGLIYIYGIGIVAGRPHVNLNAGRGFKSFYTITLYHAAPLSKGVSISELWDFNGSQNSR